MDANTLYWLFSTIAQAYGAIIGVIGLLAVYKLENQTRLRGSIKERILGSRQRLKLEEVFTSEFAALSAEEMLSRFHNLNPIQERFLVEKFNDLDRRYLEEEMKRLSNSVSLDEAIRTAFKSFMKFHIPLIVVSIFLIYLIPIVHYPASLQPTKGLITYDVFILLAIALAVSTKMIWSTAMTLLEEKKEGGD